MKKYDAGLLVLRLVLGAVFIVHGLDKFFPGHVPGGPSKGLPAFAEYLKSLQVPLPVFAAWIVAGWELGGGAALVLGLFPRIAALGLFADMAIAVAKVWQCPR